MLNLMKRAMKKVNFGVEIEFTGIHRREVAETLSEYFKTNYIRTATIFEVEDDLRRKWKLVRDNSIRVEAKEEHIYGSDMYKNELVTPILNVDDIDSLKDIISLLNEKGSIVNDSCGLHVHVGAESHEITSLKRLLIFWINHQNIFLEYFKTNQRSREKYCKLIPLSIKEYLSTNKDITDDEFKEMWYKDYDDKPTKYNKSRYQSLNLNTLYTIGTIEFRIGRGSLDYEYIEEYIIFCILISQKALFDEDMEQKRFTDMKELLKYLKLDTALNKCINHEINKKTDIKKERK